MTKPVGRNPGQLADDKRKNDPMYYQDLKKFFQESGASQEVIRGKFGTPEIQRQRQELLDRFNSTRNPPSNSNQPVQQGQNRPMPATRPASPPAGSNLSNPNTLQSMMNSFNGQQRTDRSGNPIPGQFSMPATRPVSPPAGSSSLPNPNFRLGGLSNQTVKQTEPPKFQNLLGSINKTPQAEATQSAANPTAQPTTPMQAQPNQQPQQAQQSEAPAQDNSAIDQQIAALQAQIQQLQAQKK